MPASGAIFAHSPFCLSGWRDVSVAVFDCQQPAGLSSGAGSRGTRDKAKKKRPTTAFNQI